MSNVLVIKLDLQIHITLFLFLNPKWNGFSHTILGTKRALHDLPVLQFQVQIFLPVLIGTLERNFEDYR
jgi:hypothetical protein